MSTMRLAFNVVDDALRAASVERSSASSATKRSMRLDVRRSCRNRVLAGIAMLFLGLAMGTMLGSVIVQKGDASTAQLLTVLQMLFFVGAAVALLMMLYQVESDPKADARTSEGRAGEDAPVMASSQKLAVVSDASAPDAVAEPGAAPARETLAPLNEGEAALLERLVMTTDRYDIVCEKLARRNLLSPRQAEVFSLLARGHNASYIEAKLCISLSTAKSHIGSVYRKFGVRSQQELLALVQNELDEADRKPLVDGEGSETA